MEGEAAELGVWVEALTGTELGHEVLRVLDAEEWRRRRQRLGAARELRK